MTDPRYKKLATLLVNYSCALKKSERILLDMIDVPDEFTIELIRAVRAAGATPFVETRHTRVGREQLLGISETQANDIRDLEMFRMKKMQAYIAIRGADNMNETSDVPSERMKMYSSGAGLSRQQNALVRAALADAEHGASGGHEHGGV
jgi:aminopeptidase